MTQDHNHNHNHSDIPRHSHTEEPVFSTGDMDPGSRSLANALRISFAVLKFIMIVLVIVFFSSGIFTVAPDERAMVLRFGKIRGTTAKERVLNPGLHWAIPYPVDEVIKFPGRGTVERVAVNSFWYNESQKIPGNSLNPITDGYCLTRNEAVAGVKDSGWDYNIVHLKAQVNYRISDCEMFLKNVYVKPAPAGRNYIDVIGESVRPLIKELAMDAIVSTMVNFTIEDAIKSDAQISWDVKKNLQARLNSIDSGLEIDSIQIAPITWPRQVDEAFQKSIKAKNEADTNIRNAKGYAESKINEAGGAPLYKLIMDSNLTEAQRDKAWDNSSGTVREKIADAMAYRTHIVESAKADAEYLAKLLPEYRKRPKLVIERIYQDAMQEVLSNVQETIIAQPSAGAAKKEFRILINRDPMLEKQKKTK